MFGLADCGVGVPVHGNTSPVLIVGFNVRIFAPERLVEYDVGPRRSRDPRHVESIKLPV